MPRLAAALGETEAISVWRLGPTKRQMSPVFSATLLRTGWRILVAAFAAFAASFLISGVFHNKPLFLVGELQHFALPQAVLKDGSTLIGDSSDV